MERDREPSAQQQSRPFRQKLILRLIKGIVWGIALIFGGLGLAVGYYALSLDDRLARDAARMLSRATLFDVHIGRIESNMRDGIVAGADLRFEPGWGHIDHLHAEFDPKALKKIGVIHLKKIRLEGGDIKHWGKLGFLRPCAKDQAINTPQSLRLHIAQIEWVNITKSTKLPWPDYFDDGPLNVYFGPMGGCLLGNEDTKS